SPPEGFADLAELICQAGSCVAGGMRGLRELKTISFGRLSSEVAGLAKRGAQLERRIMAELFRFKGEHATRRALQWQRAVDSTGGQRVSREAASAEVIFAALAGAITWHLATWWFARPTSSPHAITGAFAGAGIAKAGGHVIKLASIEKTVIFIFLSPAVGLLLA